MCRSGGGFVEEDTQGAISEVVEEQSYAVDRVMQRHISVAVADSHPMVREALAAMLGDETDIEVAGEAKSGIEILEIIRESRVDVVVMDSQILEREGPEFIREAKALRPDMKLVILVVFVTEQEVLRGIEAGANAFILKDAAAEKLCEVTRMVRETDAILDLMGDSDLPRFVEVLSQRAERLG
jgi:DNA-binding NarL/FixJ family response regulator